MLIATEDANKTHVREHFDRDANWQGGVYDSGTDPHAAGVRRRLSYVLDMLIALPEFKPGVTLDVGCGPGAYLSELSKLGCRCYGMDLSEEMLNACARRLGPRADVRLMTGDTEHIPFGPVSADLLLSIGVLQYLRSPLRAINEMARVLRTGGLAVVSFQNLFSLSNLDWVARERMKSLLLAAADGEGEPENWRLSMVSPFFLNHSPVPHEYRLLNPWAFETLMDRAGFSVAASMTYGYEFRFLRRLKIAPGRVLDRIEIAMERALRNSRLPYLPYSGEFYIGIFRKRANPVVYLRGPVIRGEAICAAG